MADFEAWREARLASEVEMQPYWQASPMTWSGRHTHRVWVREVLERWRGARRAGCLSWAIEVGGELRGQVELASIHAPEGEAELGIWVDSRLAGRHVATSVIDCVAAHAFTELGVERLVAPISVSNERMQHVAATAGFTRVATTTRIMETGQGRMDHEDWVLLARDRERTRRRGQAADPLDPPAADSPRPRRLRFVRTTVECLRWGVSVAKASWLARRPGGRELSVLPARGASAQHPERAPRTPDVA